MNKKVLIHLEDVKMHFEIKKNSDFFSKKQYVKAVDGVTIDIYENETFGLVGESGSGKSTLGKLILRLLNKSYGSVLYNGKNLTELPEKQMRKLRKELQIVFQDPYSSLNPRHTVGTLISEALLAHGIYKKGEKALEEHILSTMQKCGLEPYMIHRYPHQFSGGQRQRIGIARALALNPKFVVCDEAVSTLDVSIQSQIINLLLDLKEQNNLTYLFISHDLSTVRFISDRIAVMYLGNIIEIAPTENIFDKPHHPYTIALIDAIPNTEQESKSQINVLEGDVPSPTNPPSGCKFHTRCKFVHEKCKNEAPKLTQIGEGHLVACHYPINV